MKAHVVDRVIGDDHALYTIEVWLNGEHGMTVKTIYDFDHLEEYTTLSYIGVINEKTGKSVEYANDGTAETMGFLLGMLFESGEMYFDYEKINALISDKS